MSEIESKDRIYTIWKIREDRPNYLCGKAVKKKDTLSRTVLDGVSGNLKKEDKSFYSLVKVPSCRGLCLGLARLQRCFIFSSET